MSNCSKGSSSGSTGHPVIYYLDNEAKSANRAAVLFCKFLGEYRLGDKWLNIWGNPTAVNVEWKKVSSRISKYVFNETKFPAYKLNDSKEFETLYKVLLKNKPKHIYGYTNAIYLFAKYAEARSGKIEFIKSVATTAENLQDFQRSIIENNFGMVYDQYGCSEINGIAAQTAYDNHYSIADKIRINFITDKNFGSGSKKIIIDTLNEYLPKSLKFELVF